MILQGNQMTGVLMKLRNNFTCTYYHKNFDKM